MTAILAIDPGPKASAWLAYDPEVGPINFGITENDLLLDHIRRPSGYHLSIFAEGPGLSFSTANIDEVVIEQMQSYGMAVGREVFDTVYWSGRFAEAAHPIPVALLSRPAVKGYICNDARAKDANIRQALVDRFGGRDVTRKGGILYGISKDVWSALAIAVTYSEGIR